MASLSRQQLCLLFSRPLPSLTYRLHWSGVRGLGAVRRNHRDVPASERGLHWKQKGSHFCSAPCGRLRNSPEFHAVTFQAREDEGGGA